MEQGKRSQLAAMIGPRSDYYLARFEMIDMGAGRTAGWNWPAFFLSTAWFEYRGMSGYAMLNFIAPWLTYLAVVMIAMVSGEFAAALMLVYFAFAYVVLPVKANALYYRHLKKEIARASAAGNQPAPVAGRVATATILGLVTVGVPAGLFVIASSGYGDFIVRSQVSEAISLMGAAKTPVAEYYANQRKWPDKLDQLVENTRGKYTENLAITTGAGAKSGVLTITATIKPSGVNPALPARRCS